MNWLNRNSRILLIALSGILILVSVVIFLAVSGRADRGQICTLIGCVGGLDIELVGLPETSPYEISIVYPSGEIQTLRCGSANDESPAFANSCSQKGAFFSLASDSLPPKEITVTVTLNGTQTSEVFQPVYQESQPNGEGCSPTCYSAQIVMNISR